MTGFDKKVVHFSHKENVNVTFTMEVDMLGNGSWHEYKTIQVPRNSQYAFHQFPDGYAAHWIRFKTDSDCTATVYLHYN